MLHCRWCILAIYPLGLSIPIKWYKKSPFNWSGSLDSWSYAKMLYYYCCSQKHWPTVLHKLRSLRCLSHFIKTKNGKTILWMPQQFLLCITQHTAYINCSFVLCVQRLRFLCKDLIGLIVEFYRLWEHARDFFLFLFL